MLLYCFFASIFVLASINKILYIQMYLKYYKQMSIVNRFTRKNANDLCWFGEKKINVKIYYIPI